MDICTPADTLDFIKGISLSHFPNQSTSFTEEVFKGVQGVFEGEYEGYLASDTAYHDFKHTCEASVALARLLDGHIKSGQPPDLTARDFELSVAAMLLHDSGFMKEYGDDEGTGAKYTVTHVERSGQFAALFLPAYGVTEDEIRFFQLAIDCAGINVSVDALPFRNPKERFLSCTLGTGDILGQMAAPDYPERLPGLYREFVEATSHSEDKTWIAGYKSEVDLLKKTRGFYEKYIQHMLDEEWDGVYKRLEFHFGQTRNLYLEAIEQNIDRIDTLIKD